jgi:hypothetical protein
VSVSRWWICQLLVSPQGLTNLKLLNLSQTCIWNADLVWLIQHCTGLIELRFSCGFQHESRTTCISLHTSRIQDAYHQGGSFRRLFLSGTMNETERRAWNKLQKYSQTFSRPPKWDRGIELIHSRTSVDNLLCSLHHALITSYRSQ